MFSLFVDVVVIAFAMVAVMVAIKGCMRPANASAESSTAGFASASKYSVPGLIAAGSAADGCLLQPLMFSMSLWRSQAMVGLMNCSYSTRCRHSSSER